MAITKTLVEDKIEIVGDYKAVQIRTATVIKEDGVELSRSFIEKFLNVFHHLMTVVLGLILIRMYLVRVRKLKGYVQ
jgi:hypothetical protein